MTQIKMTTLRIKYGRLVEYLDAMEKEILPLVRSSDRQRLLAAYRTITGPSYFEVIHIWELDDANAHVRGLEYARDPVFVKVVERLRDLVETEGSNLLVKTPYCP